MKLKYNHNGETESIPLSSIKPEGKRLAVHHNDQNFYAPLVDAGDATASNLRTVFKGEMLAVSQMQMPEVTNILIEPPTVAVMQGQSATAIVSASGNEAVTGLSYSIAHNPTWITISDECILIQPSDNDLGEAIVEVIAKDTGSNASMSAAFVAEALLRPIISSLSIVPPAVTVGQGQSATALIEAEANAAVTGLSYSLDGAPDWVTNDNDTIWVEPTTNDLGTSTVNVVAYDTNSSARADTEFIATAQMVPQIYGVIASPSILAVDQGDSAVVTLSADYNSAVTSIEYSLTNAPSWMTLSGNQITVAPTTNDLGTVTVTITARDTGSNVQASTELAVTAQVVQPRISGITVQPAPQIKGSRIVAWQKNTLNYPLTCTANSAVTSVRYSLAPSENNPPWLSVYSNKTLRAAPTTANSALGDTATVTLVAYDTKSDAQATTEVNVRVIEKPSIGAVTLMPSVAIASPDSPETVTLTAPYNNAATGIEASLGTHPAWVSASGRYIYVSPQASDVGDEDAVITVRAVDTGSTVSSGTKTFTAKARAVVPQISNVSVCPSPSLKSAKVVGWQGSSLIYPLTCTANSAVASVKYSLQGAPSWMLVNYNTVTGDSRLSIAPNTTNSALGDTSTVTIVAYDTGSTVQATTTVATSVSLRPSITSVSVQPRTLIAWNGYTETATVTPVINDGVESVEYEIIDAPSWVSMHDGVFHVSPTDDITETATISVVAHDTGSYVATKQATFIPTKTAPPSISPITLTGTNNMQWFAFYVDSLLNTSDTNYLTCSVNANYGALHSNLGERYIKYMLNWAGAYTTETITSTSSQLRVSPPLKYNTGARGVFYEPYTVTAYDIPRSGVYSTAVAKCSVSCSGTATIDTRIINRGGLTTYPNVTLQSGTNSWADINVTITLDVAESLSASGYFPKGASVTLSGGVSKTHELHITYPKNLQTKNEYNQSEILFTPMRQPNTTYLHPKTEIGSLMIDSLRPDDGEYKIVYSH